MPFFKHLGVYVLILSTIGSTLTIPLVYLDFEMRREYIAEVLCINRDKPITVCGGTCYLKLNLEKSQPNSEATPASFANPISFFFQHVAKTDLNKSVALLEIDLFIRTTEGVPNKVSISIFQPPQGLV